MPMTVTSTSGRVTHMRPLPSHSTTATVPVSHTEVRPAHREAGAQEALAQVAPGDLRELRRGVGERRAAGDGGAEEVADLGPVAVDGRHEDVRGRVVTELDDEARSVSTASIPAPRS